MTHPNGSIHWLAAKGESATDGEAPPMDARRFIDITERKVLEVRLLALSEALEARVKERTQELEASYAQLQASERASGCWSKA